MIAGGAPQPARVVPDASSGTLCQEWRLNIAYQVTGSGPRDLVLIPGFVSHLDLDWAEPRHAHFLERLGSLPA